MHGIPRTDDPIFNIQTVKKCGNCHADVMKTYYETYHDKISKLGYSATGTAPGRFPLDPVNIMELIVLKQLSNSSKIGSSGLSKSIDIMDNKVYTVYYNDGMGKLG